MTKITDDLFGIAGRLKEIDPRYEVFWDGVNYKIFFERALGQRPYMTAGFLDERIIWRVREELDFDAVMEHNAAIVRGAERAMDDAVRGLGEMFDYASETSQEVIFTKGGKTW